MGPMPQWGSAVFWFNKNCAGTPKRGWPKQARRKRIILTSRRFLSPLDTGPSRRLPEGLRPVAEVHGPLAVRGG